VTLNRANLYRLPYSRTDNAGGWVEVTDECDLSCAACYRQRLEGHRPLEEIKRDILALAEVTNCDRIAVAGGEPLIYPDIIKVIDFISSKGIKPALLTNGVKLTRDLALELKKAGLVQYYIHVDSGMDRPNWKGKDEIELNELRQYFADLIWDVGGVQCGFNTTIFRSTLRQLPGIVEWCRRNIPKVSHLSAIAYRGFPVVDGIQYMVGDRLVDAGKLRFSSANLDEINITAEEMFDLLEGRFTEFNPCAYTSGTAVPESYKYLITVQVGSKGKVYGFLGAKTFELVQTCHHFIVGKYPSFLKKSRIGKIAFLGSLIDAQVRKTLANYLRVIGRNPLRAFDKIYAQTIFLQQPDEILEGKINMCGGCCNRTLYRGNLVESCRLDEYRLFGGLVTPVFKPPDSTLGKGD
jgi:hypothetical protein